jgi:hypothetical protein
MIDLEKKLPRLPAEEGASITIIPSKFLEL